MNPSDRFVESLVNAYPDLTKEKISSMTYPELMSYVSNALLIGHEIPNIDGSPRYDLNKDPIEVTKADGTKIKLTREMYNTSNFDNVVDKLLTGVEIPKGPHPFDEYLLKKIGNFFILNDIVVAGSVDVNPRATFNRRG